MGSGKSGELLIDSNKYFFYNFSNKHFFAFLIKQISWYVNTKRSEQGMVSVDLKYFLDTFSCVHAYLTNRIVELLHKEYE